MSDETARYRDPNVFERLFAWARRDTGGLISLIALTIIVVCALFASWIAPYDPTFQPAFPR